MAMFYLVILFLNISFIFGFPIESNEIDYLRRFNYLPQKTGIGDELLHGDVYTSALKLLQKFGNIPETGFLDDDTKKLLTTPRCGNPDFEEPPNLFDRQKRYVLAPSKWDKLNLTWKFQNKNFPRKQEDLNNIQKLIQEVFDIWEYNSNLKFKHGNDSSDILIDFFKGKHGDGFDFDGRGYILAHAFYPTSSYGGDVHLDEDELWNIEDGKDANSDGINLFYTLLHEVGHSLGLEHSSMKDSIMFPFYQIREIDRKCKLLGNDDILGISQQYGKVKKFRFGPICFDNNQNVDETPEQIDADSSPTIVDRCNLTNPMNAIAIINNELMIFKNEWVWRLQINSEGEFQENSTLKISSLWKEMKNFVNIDAVHQMENGNVAFFSGNRIFVYDNFSLSGNYDMKSFGFDERLKKVDAILSSKRKEAIYVFSGAYFWKVDENLHVVSNESFDYPQLIRRFWKKLDLIKITAALEFEEEIFFLSPFFTYKFNEDIATLEIENPIVSKSKWMSCEYSKEELITLDKADTMFNDFDKNVIESQSVNFNKGTRFLGGIIGPIFN